MNPAADYAVSAAQPESAPYGRACAGCSKAKCRCIMRGEGLSCKRCHRLQRECHPSMVVRKRSAKRPAHRTAELEKKLDSLVTLLRSQPPGGSRVSEDSSETSPGGNSGGPRQSGSGTEQSQGTQEPPCFYPTPITAAASPYPEPSPSQAQEYFEDFIKTYVHAFPFIHFSASTT